MDAPDSLLDRNPIFIAIFLFVCVNGLLFFILSIFFDGGAFPWGEIRGDRYFVIANSSQTEVSQKWFYLTFWHGTITWLCAGLCIFIVWGESMISNLRNNNWTGALGRMGGMLFIFGWVTLVLIEAVAIVT